MVIWGHWDWQRKTAIQRRQGQQAPVGAQESLLHWDRDNANGRGKGLPFLYIWEVMGEGGICKGEEWLCEPQSQREDLDWDPQL